MFLISVFLASEFLFVCFFLILIGKISQTYIKRNLRGKMLFYESFTLSFKSTIIVLP